MWVNFSVPAVGMSVNFKGPIPTFLKHPSLAQVHFLSALLCHGVYSFKIDSIMEWLNGGKT